MSQTDRNNAKWALELQAGESDAWNELFDRLGPRIWRVICRTGGFRQGEEDQVEDIRQETFLAAVKSIRQYRGSASIETWLHRLAVNKTIDHIRKSWRHPMESLDAADPETAESTANPSLATDTPADDLMRTERRTKLHECLETLRLRNERWWTVVVMYHFGDMPYKDVAQTLAIPLGTVQGVLHRARMLLADCVEGNKTVFSDDQGSRYEERRS
jgi:RNA polymerase sigma-70 factor (ECF subfamily)